MEGSSLTNRLNVAMMKLGYDPSVGELAVHAVTLRPWARQLRMVVSLSPELLPAWTCTAAVEPPWARRWCEAEEATAFALEQSSVQSMP